MPRSTQLVFIGLTLSQAAHSVEEYLTRLYDVMPPSRFITSLFSQNIPLGFALANSLLVAVGLCCWVYPVCSNLPSARALTWFWTLLELSNGLGHSFFAFERGAYFPGVPTAPLLLFIAAWLASLLLRPPTSPSSGST